MRISPDVGAVIREMSLSSVDLPAPFRPVIASASPRFTFRQTSFSARKDWFCTCW